MSYVTITSFTYKGLLNISVEGLNAPIPYTADNGTLLLKKYVFTYPNESMNSLVGTVLGLNLVPGYDYGAMPSGGCWTLTITAQGESFSGTVLISPGENPCFPNFIFKTVDQNYSIPTDWIFS
jgi:hypothetical protein